MVMLVDGGEGEEVREAISTVTKGVLFLSYIYYLEVKICSVCTSQGYLIHKHAEIYKARMFYNMQ
jgi:hypothetical protein